MSRAYICKDAGKEIESKDDSEIELQKSKNTELKKSKNTELKKSKDKLKSSGKGSPKTKKKAKTPKKEDVEVTASLLVPSPSSSEVELQQEVKTADIKDEKKEGKENLTQEQTPAAPAELKDTPTTPAAVEDTQSVVTEIPKEDALQVTTDVKEDSSEQQKDV